MSGSHTPSESPVVPPVPEVPTLPEHTIIPSIVEKKDFSPEELTLINTRIQSLEDTVKEKLKNKEAKLTLTPEKIAELKADLLREGAGNTKELTKENVDAIIDETDFENATVEPDILRKNVTDEISPDVIDHAREFVQKNIEGSGIMPNNFMKKIFEFFYALFGDKRISLDQSTMFDRQVAPAISTMGIDVQNASNKNDIKVMVMQKLAALSVPIEYSDRYFKYIQEGIGPNDIPQKMLTLFEAGRMHYEGLKDSSSLSSDPKIALESILDFRPPEPEPAPMINEADEESEKTTSTPEKVKIGEKELTGTPEEIQAYTSLEKTAKNVLGKNFDVQSSLTAVKQGNESDLTTISRDIFFKIVSKLKAVYGDTFADSITGKDITDDDKKLLKLDYLELNKKTPKTLAETLEKNLRNIFWSQTNALEVAINQWSKENTTKKEIAQKLLQSIKGYQGESGEKFEKEFQPEIAKGYDRLIAQNMEQTSNWQQLKETTLNDAASTEALKAYITGSPVLKTETI